MRREDFEHLIGAAAEATGYDQFVVIGSQAITAVETDPPETLLESTEADIYPLDDPQGVDDIDGSLGEGSPFHVAYGYYAHGVGPETAQAPRGWQERLVRVDVPPRPGSKRSPVAWCLEANDLVLAKCVAGRERDWEYAAAAIKAGLVDPTVLLERVPELPIPAARREHVAELLRGIVARRPGHTGAG
jgi:uncharacterized nucleotidyltransferase DUF6036